MGKKLVKFSVYSSGALVYKKTGRFIEKDGITIKDNRVYKNGRLHGYISKPDEKTIQKTSTLKKNYEKRNYVFKNRKYLSDKQFEKYKPYFEKRYDLKKFENLKNVMLKTKNFEAYEKMRKMSDEEKLRFMENYYETADDLGFEPPSDGKEDSLEELNKTKYFMDEVFKNYRMC